MKLYELLKENESEISAVACSIHSYYYSGSDDMTQDQCLKTYSMVLEELMTITPRESDFVIAVDIEFDQDEEYVDVHGIPLSGGDEKWAIEMSDWAEWLGAEVDETSLARFNHSDLIGHILWEMTFFGYTNQEIIDQYNSLKALHDRVQSGEEKLYQLVGFDENGEPKFVYYNQDEE